jgi:hypothetical protein
MDIKQGDEFAPITTENLKTKYDVPVQEISPEGIPKKLEQFSTLTARYFQTPNRKTGEEPNSNELKIISIKQQLLHIFLSDQLSAEDREGMLQIIQSHPLYQINGEFRDYLVSGFNMKLFFENSEYRDSWSFSTPYEEYFYQNQFILFWKLQRIGIQMISPSDSDFFHLITKPNLEQLEIFNYANLLVKVINPEIPLEEVVTELARYHKHPQEHEILSKVKYLRKAWSTKKFNLNDQKDIFKYLKNILPRINELMQKKDNPLTPRGIFMKTFFNLFPWPQLETSRSRSLYWIQNFQNHQQNGKLIQDKMKIKSPKRLMNPEQLSEQLHNLKVFETLSNEMSFFIRMMLIIDNPSVDERTNP